jgi:hypothetical protein
LQGKNARAISVIKLFTLPMAPSAPTAKTSWRRNDASSFKKGSNAISKDTALFITVVTLCAFFTIALQTGGHGLRIEEIYYYEKTEAASAQKQRVVHHTEVKEIGCVCERLRGTVQEYANIVRCNMFIQ